MRFHTEVPLPALARGVHLQVPFFLPIRRRTRRVDDAGIHGRALVHLQPVLGQVYIDHAEQVIPQVVPLHEVAELADGGFVRCGFPTEVDAHESAHRQGIVQNLLGGQLLPENDLVHVIQKRSLRVILLYLSKQVSESVVWRMDRVVVEKCVANIECWLNNQRFLYFSCRIVNNFFLNL